MCFAGMSASAFVWELCIVVSVYSRVCVVSEYNLNGPNLNSHSVNLISLNRVNLSVNLNCLSLNCLNRVSVIIFLIVCLKNLNSVDLDMTLNCI